MASPTFEKLWNEQKKGTTTVPAKESTIDRLIREGKATPIAPEPKKEGLGKKILKTVFGAPATMIARPIQLTAQLAGVSPETIDKFSQEKLGGFVAPVPRNATDVIKDIGRGAETVAFGVGASGAKAVAKGALARTGVKEAAKEGAKVGLKSGALAGAGSAVAETGNLGSAPMGALKGAALGAGIGAAGGAVAAKLTKKFGKPTTEEMFNQIKPKLSGKEIGEKVSQGLVDFDEAGNYILKPSTEDLRLSEIGRNIFKNRSNTAQKAGVVQKTISKISEEKVLPILQKSEINGSLDDVYKYIDQIQPTKQFAKKINPNAYEAFSTIKNDSKDVIANFMKSEIKKNPKMNFHEALWRARQRIDDLIEDQFGSSAFDDPLKNSAREATIKARDAVQRFLVDSVSGKDMAKMSLAREGVGQLVKRGIKSADDESLDELVESLYKQLGGTESKEQISKEFAKQMKYLSDIYTIRDKYLAPRIAKEDFSGFGRVMKNNPKTTKTLKAIGGIGLGSAGVGYLGGKLGGQ